MKKWRLIVVASVLLNGVLLAAFLANRRAEPAQAAGPVVVQTNIARAKDQSRMLRPMTVELGTNAFHWGSVESPDYREYIAKLREIGCPEETIRDIIIADVNKLFAGRVAGLYPSPKDFKFWRVENRAVRLEERGREQKRRDLEREKRALLKELLGIDYDVEMARLSGRPDEDDYRLGFLSPEKQELLNALQAKYRELERALGAEGGFRNPENRAKLTALRAQREAEMAQALGPQDFQEYQLRNSFTARNMRDTLTSFEPTEDEFRQIFDIKKLFDEQYGFTRGGDQSMREQREAAQAKLDEQLRATLGEQRYHDYMLAQDDRYRNTYDWTQRNDLPRSTADALHDILKPTQDTFQQIANNNTLSAEEKAALWAKVKGEALAAMQPMLGDKMDPFLRERDNGWLNRPPPGQNTSPRGFNGGDGGGNRGRFDRGERGGGPRR